MKRRDFLKSLGELLFAGGLLSLFGLPYIVKKDDQATKVILEENKPEQRFVGVSRARFNVVDKNGDIISEHAFDDYLKYHDDTYFITDNGKYVPFNGIEQIKADCKFDIRLSYGNCSSIEDANT